MRRLFIYLIVAILVVGALKAMHHPRARFAPPPARWHRGPEPRDDGSRGVVVTAEARRQAHEAAAEARRALDEAGRELRQAYREARDEVSRAYREARDELRQAYREVVADHAGRPPLPAAPPTPAAPPALVEAEGLPVPIVPGTRVTEAEAAPPTPTPAVPARAVSLAQPAAPSAPVAANPTANPRDEKAEATPQGQQAVPGDICANEERADADARNALRLKVAEWLSPDVPASWTPPADLLKSMVVGTRIDPIVKDYGTLYKAELTADFSPRHKAELVEAYNREVVQDRLMTIGGVLAFVLFCLAALSGYIRADEATKGYYTNRLRMLAAAGVGAAGVIVYRMLV